MLADQMLTTIEYVHSKGYIHRDLKSANFCVDTLTEQRIYLIDFGLAQKYPYTEDEDLKGFKFWHPTSSIRAQCGGILKKKVF